MRAARQRAEATHRVIQQNLRRQRQAAALLLPRLPRRITPYHRELIENAKALCDGRHYPLAVIVAQMACEIVAEVAFTRHIEDRGIVDLRRPIEALLPNFDLGNPKVRKVYEALSRHMIGQAAFWNDYTAVVKLRNDIVHKGARTTAQVARDAVTTAEELVQHVEDTMRALDAKSST